MVAADQGDGPKTLATAKPDYKLDKTELKFRLDFKKFKAILEDAGRLEDFDYDGDGNIDLDEFKEMMSRKPTTR